MPVTYTSRKGLTYYLCKGVTKTGKPRYYFAREPQGEPVEEIPAGFKIGESVNGLVFLEKDRPAQIHPEEVAAVQAAVRRHPRPRSYRVNVKHDRIEVYEQVGPEAEDLIKALGLYEPGLPDNLADRIRAERERYAQWTPVLRFILADATRRTFGAQRMHYGGQTEWFDLSAFGPVDQLARRLIPTLGTDRFFELY
ncbi:MAG: hypothetical protein KKA73_20490 [Chloroflexi bacterium]|nr:hypothetical protein [Chloroflexota bacterium]MBU1750069.1 hypothetical protein [Chloroflexota bacterium]